MPSCSAAGLTSQRWARRASVQLGLGDLGGRAVVAGLGAAARRRGRSHGQGRLGGRHDVPQQALDLGADLDRLGGAAGDHHLPHRVVELPDVAGPAVAGEARHDRGRQPERRRVLGGDEAVLLADPPQLLGQEVAEEAAEVVAALPQRRDHQLVAGEPVEQGGPKAPRLDGVLQVGVGRRDHPHVHLLDAGRADALDLAGLDHAQQHHLDLRGGLADLVQEERAAVGALEEPRLVADRAGVGALDRPEQLGGGERRRDRPHVHRQAGAVAARAGLVDGAGHQLLAGAGLAAEQHGDLEVGHPADLVPHPLEPLALADQPEPLGGIGGQQRRQRVQQQDHPVGELEDHPSLDLLRGERARLRDQHPLRHQAGAAPADGEGDGALRLAGDQQGGTADAAVQQRPGAGAVRRLEGGIQAGERDRPAGGQAAEDRPLAGPADVGMVEDRQRGMANPRASAPLTRGGEVVPNRLLDGETGRCIRHSAQCTPEAADPRKDKKRLLVGDTTEELLGGHVNIFPIKQDPCQADELGENV